MFLYDMSVIMNEWIWMKGENEHKEWVCQVSEGGGRTTFIIRSPLLALQVPSFDYISFITFVMASLRFIHLQDNILAINQLLRALQLLKWDFNARDKVWKTWMPFSKAERKRKREQRREEKLISKAEGLWMWAVQRRTGNMDRRRKSWKMIYIFYYSFSLITSNSSIE